LRGGGDPVSNRIRVATSLDREIFKRFKIACIERDVRATEVMDELMRQYVEGKIECKIKPE
jgi:hypothetical protein